MATAGSIFFDERTASFGCLGCLEHVEVRRKVMNDPEQFLSMQELVALDHSECMSYGNVQMAKNARKYRKESKRRALIAPRRTSAA